MQEVHRLAWVVHPPFWLELYLLRYRELSRGPPPRDFLRAKTIRCIDTWLIWVRAWVPVPLHPSSMHLPLARAPRPPPDRPVVKVRYVELPWEWDSGGFSARNLPGRAATPPGRGYLAGRGRPGRPGRGSPRPGPSRPTRGGKQPRRGLGGRPSRSGKQPRRGLGRGGGGAGGGGCGGGGGTLPSTDEDESDASTPRRRPRRMNQEGLQRQLEILLNDQRQTANGRRIAGITTTNTITTTYKDGGRPRVTRNSTSVRS